MDKYKNGLKRLLKIDELLRSRGNGGISVRELAKATGISVRTIQRDLLYLQTEFDAPICESNHKYYYNSSWSLTDIAYSHEDMAALALANSVLSSLFAGTHFASMVTDRLQGILEHCAKMELMTQDFCRDEIQVAFHDDETWLGSEKFLDAILEKKCAVAKRLDSGKEVTIRPLRVIFAWNSCYLLYITSEYKDNSDFKIEFPKNLAFVRQATRLESARVPDILKGADTLTGLNCSRSRIRRDSRHGEILEVRFEGKLDYFILRYSRNADGSLSFAGDDATMKSGHLWESIESGL